MYGQIISFLFVILIIYYVVMIFLDLRKAKAAKAAEMEKNSEEEIDISDEANTFKPVLITRDDPNKTPIQDATENPEDSSTNKKKVPEQTEPNEITPTNKEPETSVSSTTPNDSTQSPQEPISKDKEPTEKPESSKENEEKEAQQPLSTDKPFRREGYREAAMTGGLDVETLLAQVDQLAETGTCPLGQVIHECQSAHF